jgi:hypothetical protein
MDDGQLSSFQHRIIASFASPSARRFVSLRERGGIVRMEEAGLLKATHRDRGSWIELTPLSRRLWPQLRRSDPFS